MTLMEKFAALTPEQRIKFAETKDTATLDVFASECDIKLTDEEKLTILEYFKTGTLPLSDDDMDLVAGGASKPSGLTGIQAINDGRTEIVSLSYYSAFCSCTYPSKYAKLFHTGGLGHTITDVKCYVCGKTWDKVLIPWS